MSRVYQGGKKGILGATSQQRLSDPEEVVAVQLQRGSSRRQYPFTGPRQVHHASEFGLCEWKGCGAGWWEPSELVPEERNELGRFHVFLVRVCASRVQSKHIFGHGYREEPSQWSSSYGG